MGLCFTGDDSLCFKLVPLACPWSGYGRHLRGCLGGKCMVDNNPKKLNVTYKWALEFYNKFWCKLGKKTYSIHHCNKKYYKS